jgi:hypothetical protein
MLADGLQPDSVVELIFESATPTEVYEYARLAIFDKVAAAMA